MNNEKNLSKFDIRTDLVLDMTPLDNQKTYIKDDITVTSLYLDNDEIVINYNGTEVSRWKQSTFQAKELRLKDASWGYAFVWMPRPNGSYSLRKVVD